MPRAGDAIYFKAVLRPNPPLAPFACFCLVAIVATINATIALIFILRGAWPITPFLGADVLFLIWALVASSREARRREEVHLTRSKLRVDCFPARGQPAHTEFNPYWVRVQIEGQHSRQSGITLASHGKRLRIASFLSPADCDTLARALTSALAVARLTF